VVLCLVRKQNNKIKGAVNERIYNHFNDFGLLRGCVLPVSKGLCRCGVLAMRRAFNFKRRVHEIKVKLF
jgi:hypothetical protein